MSIEKKLFQYPYIMEDIKDLKEEINNLNESKYDTNMTIKYDLVNASGGGPSDKVGSQVLNIVEKCDSEIERLDKKIKKLFKLKEDIEGSLEKLDHVEKTVIKLRYFKGHKWDYIARRTSKSVRGTMNIKDKAVRKIGNDIKRQGT